MKKLFFGLLVANLPAQVIQQDINCHQGLIDLTIVDLSHTSGAYHLYYLDVDWVLLQGAYIETPPDTFYITYSGIGTEMHSFDSMMVEFEDTVILSFNVGCGGLVIKPNDPAQEPLRKEYYDLFGHQITEPKKIYYEISIFKDHHTVRKYGRIGE